MGYGALQAKRFRDAADPARDCYREIVEADYSLLKAEVALSRYNATLHVQDETIAKYFGLSSTVPVPVPPGSWYRTKADFCFRVRDRLA